MDKNELLQVIPNSVTSGTYEYTETQENILTLMMDSIQKHMSKEREFDTDLFGSPQITIDVKEMSGGIHHKKRIWSEAEAMTKKGFKFEFNKKESSRKTRVSGILVTTVHSDYGSSKIVLVMNPWALPYLLYWGKGVGGTIYSKPIALLVSGAYGKRLYKICKRYEDVGGFQMSLGKFRESLSIEDKYLKVSDLKRMLDRSRGNLQKQADVYFNYNLAKTSGSAKFNQISFSIHGIEKDKSRVKSKSNMYSLVYKVISWAYPTIKDGAALYLADKLNVDVKTMEKAYFRLKKINGDVESGENTIEGSKALIKYILKEDFKLTTSFKNKK